MKRTVTKTGTVTITSRETRLRDLLETIAQANSDGRRPGKADVVGNVPSQTRAGRYRLIDVLISRHLVLPGLDGKGYHLEITPAGREVLDHGTTEVTWEEDDYGEIRWTVTEHICDGAAFTWSFGDRDEALGFAARNREIPDPDDSVTSVVLTELWQHSGDSAVGGEVLSSETIWSRDKAT